MIEPLAYIVAGLRPLAIPIDSCHPDPANARKGHAVDRIAGSLAQYGQRKAIVVNSSEGNKIEAGNGTWLAAKSLGWSHIAAVIVEDDPMTAVGYGIADNRLGHLSEWDAGTLAALLDSIDDDLPTGFEGDELDELLAELGAGLDAGNGGGQGDAEPQVDRAEELRQLWGTELGQLWQIGEHRLIVGDCTDRAVVERVMGGERAGMVFTDPPFATFASSTGKLEITDFGMIRPFYEKLLDATLPHVELGRGLFICCDWRSYPMLFGLGGIDPKNLIVWVHGALRMGSHFRPQHEFILYATNTAFDKRFSKKNKTYEGWKIADRGVGDVWHIKQAEASPGSSRIHASQKPVELPAFAMTHASLENEIIGDWFAGSGTVMVACQNLSRRCRAIEISPAYCAVILQRMSDAFPGIDIGQVT